MFVSSGHFLAQFQQFNLISIYARNLKLFRSFLIKSLVTNYINKIGIDLVIFGLLSDVGETFINFYQFFYQFSRKVPLLVFCGANHHKCLDFLFLREICIAALWSLKKKIQVHYLEIPPKINTIPLPLYTGVIFTFPSKIYQNVNFELTNSCEFKHIFQFWYPWGCC